MADDYKKKIANFYRTEYQLPVDATDDSILAFAKEDNPDGLKEVTKRMYQGIPEEQKSVTMADGHDAWAKQNPFANTIDTLAKPGQWFQQNVMSPAVEGINNNTPQIVKDSVKYTPVGLAMGISDQADKVAEETTSSLDKFITSPNPGALGDLERYAARGARDTVDLVQGLNPIPKNVGELAVQGTMELAGALGSKIANSTPHGIEESFRKFPGGGKGFDEAHNAVLDKVGDEARIAGNNLDKENYIKAKAEAEKQFAIDKDEAQRLFEKNMEIAGKRTEAAKLYNKAEMESVLAQQKEANEWSRAARKNLTGSEDIVPQLPQAEMGYHISRSLSELNPYSEVSKAKEPIVTERNSLYNAANEYKVSLPVVKAALLPIFDELDGIVKTPGEASAASVLKKYLDQKEVEPIPGHVGFAGKVGAVRDLNLSAKDILKDAGTLGDLAESKLKNDPVASVSLSKAQNALQVIASDMLPQDLKEGIITNRRKFGEWYKKYRNDHIKTINGELPSQMFDPIFASEEAAKAYEAAVSPAEWELVQKNKTNEILGKILNSENPKATFEAMKRDAPGFMDSFLDKNQQVMMQGVINNKDAILQAQSDMLALEKAQDALDKQNRRAGDTGIVMRKDEAKLRDVAEPTPTPAVMKDKSTRGTKLFVGNLASAGVLGVVAHYNPVLAAGMGVVAAAGFGPELLGRLYIATPELRSMFLDLGKAPDHFEVIKNAARITVYLEAKQREVQKALEPGKDGKKNKLPADLKKFVPLTTAYKSNVGQSVADTPNETPDLLTPPENTEELGSSEDPGVIPRPLPKVSINSFIKKGTKYADETDR